MFGQQDDNANTTGTDINQPVADASATPADTAMPAVPAQPGDNPSNYAGSGTTAAPNDDEATTAPVASDMGTSGGAAADADADVNIDNDDLIDIKQQALQQLSPLVGHLDQSPEEKFRTTMMMIQASDNSALIKDAYTAAQQITDEKTRAQALLDIVNEINYFTQHQEE